MPSYPVPVGRTRVETVVQKSRFVSTIQSACSAAEAQGLIREIRAEMPDATHHVYAFRAGHGASVIEGMSDDGEPAGTSGPPTLAVVRGSGFGDVLLVTTRYFGGTKLGTGGLVAAYTLAAQNVLKATPTVPKTLWRRLQLEFDYRFTDAVRHAIHTAGARIDESDYGAAVRLVCMIPEETMGELEQRLRDICRGQARMTRD
jgi:uncharacterized YigZ family protein